MGWVQEAVLTPIFLETEIGKEGGVNRRDFLIGKSSFLVLEFKFGKIGEYSDL